MRIDTPRLSIGLPVYNGEKFLKEALDSLLAQSYTEFELIILDNASIDTTPMICANYARTDSRIKYIRNDQNIGASRNFKKAFELGHGEYFKWAAHDDVLEKDFLSKCIEVLDNDPSIILAYSKASLLNEDGKVFGPYDYNMKVSAYTPYERFKDLVLVKHFCISIFGVMRRDFLAKTDLIRPFVGSDRCLLAELGLWGRHYEIPEYLFHRRDHKDTSGKSFTQYSRISWFDPSRRGKIHLPYWRLGWEYFRSVSRVPMRLTDRVRCYSAVIHWFFKRGYALREDIKAVIVQVFPFTRDIRHLITNGSRKNVKEG